VGTLSRSYLFIPGNTPSMIQNLDVFESDAVILDLEDSVVHYDKDAARTLVKNFIKHVQPHIDIYIRINDIQSPYFEDDIASIQDLNIRGIVLPKASIEAVKLLSTKTTKDIIPIIESPLAVLDARDIISHKHVTAVLLGAEDCTKEMNITRTAQGLEIDYMRHYIALVAHAYHKEAIDTPWIHKDDETGLLQDTTYAKSIGFTAKSAIHPNHVATINKVFTPSEKEIFEAKRIVKKAEDTNKGAFLLDGKMVDAPIIEKAQKLLQLARKYHIE